MKKLSLLFVLVIAVGIMSCEKAEMDENVVTGEGESVVTEQIPVPEKAVSAATVTIKDKVWTVEIAASDDERTKGLGGRDLLPQQNGMWFVFPQDTQDPFWMKDTKFDLDIIFVGDDMKIVDIKPGNKALSEDLIQPVSKYRYVLEINEGDSDGLEIGDEVKYSIGMQ